MHTCYCYVSCKFELIFTLRAVIFLIYFFWGEGLNKKIIQFRKSAEQNHQRRILSSENTCTSVFVLRKAE